jgi:hypothetical protein
MTLGSRVAGDAEDAENRPVGVGLEEMGDGGAQLAVPFWRQIDVLVSEDKDLTAALSNTRIVSGAGAAKAAHNLKVVRMADAGRTGEAGLEDSSVV